MRHTWSVRDNYLMAAKAPPAVSYRRDRGPAAKPPNASGTAAPAMTPLPPVPAPTRPAPTCGPTGPDRTGRARAGGVFR